MPELSNTVNKSLLPSVNGRAPIRTSFALQADDEAVLGALKIRFSMSEKELLDFFSDAFRNHLSSPAFMKELLALKTQQKPATRKTRVITRRTYDCLEHAAAAAGITRDHALSGLVRLAQAATKMHLGEKLEMLIEADRKLKDAVAKFEAASGEVKQMLDSVGVETQINFYIEDFVYGECEHTIDQLNEEIEAARKELHRFSQFTPEEVEEMAALEL